MTETIADSSAITIACGGLVAGQFGIIRGRPGVGKSSLLTQHAISTMLLDQNVLHISIVDSVERVRLGYDELFGLSCSGSSGDVQRIRFSRAERFRVIHAYRNTPDLVRSIRDAVEMLRSFAQFEPTMIIVDGSTAADNGGLKELAQSLKICVWASAPVAGESDADVQLSLLASDEQRLMVLRNDVEGAEYLLNAQSLSTVEPEALPIVMDAHAVTLYSGGAIGTETAFGQCAEKHGVAEVNFTFDGHKQARTVGSVELSERELSDGDVSLLYVSERLHRTYSEGSLIRLVLKSLWHMISRSQQVFVIGTISPDDTVRGGTGWSVELAKMWRKDLWVFDQDRDDWFYWTSGAWHVGLPLIHSTTMAGTGTRVLSENGAAAIESLFSRSFSR